MKNSSQIIIKYLFCLFNLVFAVTGLAFIGLGVYSHFENTYSVYHTFFDLPASSIISLFITGWCTNSISLVLIGFIIFIVSFFGCCGSLLENKCMIYSYATFLNVIVFAEMIGGLFLYAAHSDIEMVIVAGMIANYGKPGNEDVTEKWDNLQRGKTCCGVISYKDWEANLPATCCDAALGSCNINNVYAEGCHVKKDAGFIEVTIAATGIALLQIIFISFACSSGRRSGKRGYKELLI